MKAATSNEIKQELQQKEKKQLIEICLRLSRFKKENKELLTYLLFEADDLSNYINAVKREMDENFASINTTNLYYVKKSVRKILRLANKHIRYTGDKVAETEILLHYLTSLKGLNIKWQKSNAMVKLFNNQLKKTEISISKLHEDLQYEYKMELERLRIV